MTAEQMRKTLRTELLRAGASDVGFAAHPEPFRGYHYSVTIAVALSRGILGEISEGPTPMYFQHYRAVNAQLDRLSLLTGELLRREGWDFYPIAASQSINVEGWQYRGAFSHKQAAVQAGMGRIGKSALFLHEKFGPGVRLATVFTDCALCVEPPQIDRAGCGGCRACAAACPAMAIKGVDYRPGMPREELLDAAACSRYMKDHYQSCGRGSVCGRCIYVCMKVNGLLEKNT